jgi:hypothetical protein
MVLSFFNGVFGPLYVVFGQHRTLHCFWYLFDLAECFIKQNQSPYLIEGFLQNIKPYFAKNSNKKAPIV